MSYKVRNWRKFQHYSKRNPPWIKLHYEVMTSRDWVMLSDASKLLAIVCMLIASRNEGEVPDDPEYIKRVAYLDRAPNLLPLIDSGFLLADASARKHKQAHATSETETEAETEAYILSGKPDIASQCQEVIDYLNKRAGTSFRGSSKASRKFVQGRLREGHSVDQMKQVVDLKAGEWLGTEMQRYLRPETLFNPTKFESYLNGLRPADESSESWAQRRDGKGGK